MEPEDDDEHFLSRTVSAAAFAAPESANEGNRRKNERLRKIEAEEVEVGESETLGFVVVVKKRVGEDGEKIDIVCRERK